MPWTIGDVKKHNKNISEADKPKWVAIANAVLENCIKKGGTDCDSMAIRVANSKFIKKNNKTLD
jgi:uncharacterized protein YdaT